MRKLITTAVILAICLLSAGSAFAQAAARINAGNNGQTNREANRLELRASTHLPAGVATDPSNLPVLTADGRIGFLSTAFGDSVYAFNAANGQIISSLRTGSRAARITLFDDGVKRRLAVVNLNDPGQAEPATVSIIDLTEQRQLQLVSALILPAEVSLAPTINPVFDRTGNRLMIASDRSPAIYLCDANSGQMLDRMELRNGIDSLTIVHQPNRSLIAALSTSARTVTILSLGEKRGLRQQSEIDLPVGAGLVTANNLCFNRAGTVAYLASFESNQIYSFDVATGLSIDNFAVGDAPAQIAWVEAAGQARIAVVNTGLNQGFLANTVSIVETGDDGRFGTATVFLPPLGSDLSPDSMIAFDRTGRTGFVGSLNGTIFMFDAITGEQLGELRLPGQSTRFAIDSQAKRMVALTASAQSEQLAAIRIRIATANAAAIDAKAVSVTDNTAIYATSANTAVQIQNVRAHRVRRGLRLTVEGQGFQEGAQIYINARQVKTVRESETRLTTRVSWSFLGRDSDLSIMAQNPDQSNTAEFIKHIKRRH